MKMKKLRVYTTPKRIALMILFLVVVIIAVYIMVQMVLSSRRKEAIDGLAAGLFVCYCVGSIVMLFILRFPPPRSTDSTEPAPHVPPAAQPDPAAAAAAARTSEAHGEEIEMSELQPGMLSSSGPSTSAGFSRERGRMRSFRGRDTFFNVNETKQRPRRMRNPFLEGIQEDPMSSDPERERPYLTQSSAARVVPEQSTPSVSCQRSLPEQASINISDAYKHTGARPKIRSPGPGPSTRPPSPRDSPPRPELLPSDHDDLGDDLELYLVKPNTKSNKKSRVKYRIHPEVFELDELRFA